MTYKHTLKYRHKYKEGWPGYIWPICKVCLLYEKLCCHHQLCSKEPPEFWTITQQHNLHIQKFHPISPYRFSIGQRMHRQQCCRYCFNSPYMQRAYDRNYTKGNNTDSCIILHDDLVVWLGAFFIWICIWFLFILYKQGFLSDRLKQ